MSASKHVACPVCRSLSATVLFESHVLKERETVYRCQACGLVYFEGIERERARLSESSAYWGNPGQRAIYESEPATEGILARANRRLHEIERHTAVGRILDVGCGTGQFLGVAESRGWTPYGLDISSQACEELRRTRAYPVHCGVVEDGIYQPEFFDAITLWDVIEHLVDPLETLRVLQKSLKPGGVLAAHTPDEGGSFKRLVRLVYRMSLGVIRFPLRYVYYHPHFISFDRRALDQILALAGYSAASYQREMTDLSFAKLKIRHHYPAGWRRSLVLAGLSLIQVGGKLGRISNKITVYAHPLLKGEVS